VGNGADDVENHFYPFASEPRSHALLL
jgi:hypothetical protein